MILIRYHTKYDRLAIFKSKQGKQIESTNRVIFVCNIVHKHEHFIY